MKIVHTADLHLDSPMTARLDPQKTKQRREELLMNFRGISERAHLSGASAVIIAGDLFDSELTSVRTMRKVSDMIREFSDIAFFYVHGNHESDSFSSLPDLPENLYIFGDDWTTYRIGPVTFTGRNTLAPGMFSSLSLPEDCRNIVILHGAAARGDAEIDLRAAAGKNIDYLALGHYHTYSALEIDRRGTAVYPGTPEGRGFDECGTKGYVLLNVSPENISFDFVPFAARTLHTIPCDISGCRTHSEIRDRLSTALADIPRSDLVRAELTGTYFRETHKNIRALEDDMRGRFYCFEIKDSSRPYIDLESYRSDLSLRGEFVREVMGSDLPDELKEKIIACGISALAGEETEF